MGDCSIGGLAERLVADFGERPLDIVVHSLANGPEVKKPLLEVSRNGYLGAVSASAYSMVSMVQRLGPIMRDDGAFVSLTYLASERVIPGYGGGMSSAKAALESDTRTLAFEAGRKFGCRVNTISGRPVRVARGERDRDHRQDGGVRVGERAAHREADGGGSGQRGGVSVLAAGERDHGKHGVRRQGVSRDGDGGAGADLSAVARRSGPCSRSPSVRPPATWR